MRRLLLIIAVSLLFFPLAAMAQTVPSEVESAARNGLKSFLDRIPAGERPNYGFTANDALDQAYLGDPFRLNMIAPEALLAYKAGDPVAPLLTETDMWYFPVMIQDRIRCVLIVDHLDGAWQAVSLGQAALAKSLGEVRQRWPGALGYSPVLVAVFQARKYLVMVPEEAEGTLTSLSPGQTGLAGGSAANILETLKPDVREALKQR